MKRQRIALLPVMLVVAIASGAARAASTFDAPAGTITSGGGTASGDDFHLVASLGSSHDSTPATGGGFILTGVFGPLPTPPPACPADVTGDAVVNVDDMIAVVLDWGLCDPPVACADTNGDDRVDVEDLIRVILDWGPCP